MNDMFQSLRSSLNDWQTSVEAQVTNGCSQEDLQEVCDYIGAADIQIIGNYAALDISGIVSMLDLSKIDEQLLVTIDNSYLVRNTVDFMYISTVGVQ